MGGHGGEGGLVDIPAVVDRSLDAALVAGVGVGLEGDPHTVVKVGFLARPPPFQGGSSDNHSGLEYT